MYSYFTQQARGGWYCCCTYILFERYLPTADISINRKSKAERDDVENVIEIVKIASKPPRTTVKILNLVLPAVAKQLDEKGQKKQMF